MTIEIDEKSYIVGMWFSSCPKTQNNWLSCIIKDPKNPTIYKRWSRFRYAKGAKIFNSQDEKNWSEFYTKDNQTDEDMIDFMRMAQNQIEAGYPAKDEVIVKGNLTKMMDLTKDKEWMHVKVQEIK